MRLEGSDRLRRRRRAIGVDHRETIADISLVGAQVVACATGVGCFAAVAVNTLYTSTQVYLKVQEGDWGGVAEEVVFGYGPDVVGRGAVHLIHRTRRSIERSVDYRPKRGQPGYGMRLTPEQARILDEYGYAGAALVGLSRHVK